MSRKPASKSKNKEYIFKIKYIKGQKRYRNPKLKVWKDSKTNKRLKFTKAAINRINISGGESV